mmetsp:Transcript_3960/g.4042  ORF Transcript_3960/g.4042 Transcript_3960/m.4042 type:complete len:113 (+) Transcript_3960:87-425(+)
MGLKYIILVLSIAYIDGSSLENCDYVCVEGGCHYNDCRNPKCPGGACYFLECNNPSCNGGACTFDSCFEATCRGGSCTYLNPPHTLKSGYCDGQNCNLHGIPHPPMEDHLSL